MTGEIDGLKERLTLEMNRANQAEKHAHLVVNISIDCFLNAAVKILSRKSLVRAQQPRNLYS